MVTAEGSPLVVERSIVKMFQLCHEEDAMGAWFKMPKESRDRVRQVRGDTWDCFVAICAARGIHLTPEPLSSAAGAIPSMFADIEPDLEQFREIVWAEIKQM